MDNIKNLLHETLVGSVLFHSFISNVVSVDIKGVFDSVWRFSNANMFLLLCTQMKSTRVIEKMR